MALDRGDVARAVELTRKARAVPLPPAVATEVQTPLFQLVLDVDSAAKKRGLPTTSAPGAPVTTNSGVMPAGGIELPGGVQTAGYDQNTPGPAPATPASALNAVGLDASGGQDAETLYRQGVEALSAGKADEARQLFAEAWKDQANLDPETRQQLKTKLQLMQQPLAGTDREPDSPLDQVDPETLANRKRLYREVTRELGLAYNDRIAKPLEALERIEMLRRNVSDSDVDETAKQTMLAMVDRAIKEQQKYVDDNRADIEMDVRNEQIRADLEAERRELVETDDQIAEKVEMFNDLMKDRRYAEALTIAKQVQELRPDSPIGTQMFLSSRTQVRRRMADEIAAANENSFVDHLNDAGRLDMIAPDRPIEFMEADGWNALTEARRGLDDENNLLSPAEMEIRRLLETKVDVKFRNQPLTEVLKSLELVTGVPIFIDERALAAQGIDSSQPVSLNLTQPISLRSALDLLLGQFDLTHVIGNEVLQITSREVKQGQLKTRTYKVADLVTPIPNFVTSYEDGLAGALRSAYEMNTASTNVQLSPMSAVGLAGGPTSPVATDPSVLAQYGTSLAPTAALAPGMSQGRQAGGGGRMRGAGGGTMADFGTIMQLIQTTVNPDTWEALGGPSNMFPYPQNLSLVVSTTSETHDQITELLSSLRRLQNLQITIEVRFITLSDSFFEQIGVDFDVAFDDNVTELPADDSGNSVSVGLSGPGRSFTSDLDLRFENNNFNVSPIFGGVDAGALSTFGFAILSDIEAFLFVQAAQGDNRTNVMQAPKVTLFDGQSASIQDVSQRPFVTSITPVVGDFAVAQQPVIVVLNEGTELNVQAVVSDDKRFVRLTLVPFFSQIGDVDTFTFSGTRTSRSSSSSREDDGDPATDDELVGEEENEEITQGSTVQLPTFAFTSVNTTVSVPDGGTILLGGIKRLREGRGERGLPILSKVPYINRLFRNTAIGRDASSLMLMVTPRIIIQEEEEIAQTGFDPSS